METQKTENKHNLFSIWKLSDEKIAALSYILNEFPNCIFHEKMSIDAHLSRLKTQNYSPKDFFLLFSFKKALTQPTTPVFPRSAKCLSETSCHSDHKLNTV